MLFNIVLQLTAVHWNGRAGEEAACRISDQEEEGAASFRRLFETAGRRSVKEDPASGCQLPRFSVDGQGPVRAVDQAAGVDAGYTNHEDRMCGLLTATGAPMTGQGFGACAGSRGLAAHDPGQMALLLEQGVQPVFCGLRILCRRARTIFCKNEVIAEIAPILFNHPIGLRLPARIVGSRRVIKAVETATQIGPARWADILSAHMGSDIKFFQAVMASLHGISRPGDGLAF